LAEGLFIGTNVLIIYLATFCLDEDFSVYETCLRPLFCWLLSRYLKLSLEGRRCYLCLLLASSNAYLTNFFSVGGIFKDKIQKITII